MYQVLEAHRHVIPGLPHFLNNRLTDSNEAVGLMRWTPFSPQEDSWYSYLSKAIDPSAKVQLEELHKLKNPMVLPGIEPATFQLVAT
jgi:hypothetical protein